MSLRVVWFFHDQRCFNYAKKTRTTLFASSFFHVSAPLSVYSANIHLLLLIGNLRLSKWGNVTIIQTSPRRPSWQGWETFMIKYWIKRILPAMKKPQECILNGYFHKSSQGISMIWLCKFDKMSSLGLRNIIAETKTIFTKWIKKYVENDFLCYTWLKRVNANDQVACNKIFDISNRLKELIFI